MIWTADATGAFAKPQASWTHFTGQPEEESLGWGRLRYLHPEDLEKTKTAWQEAIRAGSPIALEQRVKRADPANQRVMKRRMAIVERPFAVIKSIFGYRRFRFAGLQKAQLEWSFICAMHNIKAMFSAYNATKALA